MPPYEKPKTAYDFITKPPTPQKQPSPLSGKLPLIAGGGIALVIVLFILLSVFGGGSSSKDSFLKISQQQTEIARIAALGTKDADQNTKNIAYNTSLTLQTDRALLAKDLANNSIAFKTKDLAKGANPQTDKQLEAARAASNFDETFLKIVDTELAGYQATLSATHKQLKNKALKQRLEAAYKHSDSLRKQIKSTE